MLNFRRIIQNPKQLLGGKRNFASVPRIDVALNDEIHGFKVQAIKHIPELQLSAVRLNHINTGADYLHVSRDDSNNVFSVGFKTAPSDSTGVPHILEHTTLCGSSKYPIRDPFFKMLHRSMSTYMNAWTASDYTLYPFATQNPVDFRNLRDVYMDATFSPMLRELDFAQEGWRIEYDNPKDPSSPIIFKGVVYNEMKGAMADNSSLFCYGLQRHLLPGTTYQHNSGGDPQSITDLTHKMLVGFHRTHYHPSNSKFYSYGNLDFMSNLDFVNERISGFERLKSVPNEQDLVTPFDEPKTVYDYCPPDPMGNPEKQTKMCLSFLANDTRNTFETFGFKVFSYLLLDGPSAPMYKALIDSGIGSEYAASSGYDSSTRSSTFSVGLQGISEGDVKLVEEKIWQVLDYVRRNGFDRRRIDAAIHQIELGQKHKTANYGLNLIQGISSGWFQGANPIDIMDINKNVSHLKENLDGFFEGLVSKYFFDNTHRLLYVMKPDDTYATKLVAAENGRLQEKIAELDTEEKTKRMHDRGLELLKLQEQKEDLSCLPTLGIADISPETKDYPLDHSQLSDTPTQWRKTSTNGITYFKAVNSSLAALQHQDSSLAKYLPLFCGALTHLGSKENSMAELDEEIRLYTGGVGLSTMAATNYSDISKFESGVVLSGNALSQNVPKLFELLEYVLYKTNFDDVTRLKTLINGSVSSMMNALAYEGHAYAKSFAASSVHPASHLKESWSGLSQLEFMNSLAALSEDQLSNCTETLKNISRTILNKSKLRVAVVSSEENVATDEASLAQFLDRFPSRSIDSTNEPINFTPKSNRTFIPTPFGVNFAASVIPTVPYTHPDSIKLQVLSSLLTTHYLHPQIREKFGAYGGGSSFSGIDGLWSFYSYRDPKAQETINAFKNSVEWVISGNGFTEQEMTEAKLSIFSSIDAPVDVSSEGLSNFMYGITKEMRQARRDALFGVKSKDVVDVAAKYLLNPKINSSAILGDQNQAELFRDAGWTVRS